jgi:hypothetical protein
MAYVPPNKRNNVARRSAERKGTRRPVITTDDFPALGNKTKPLASEDTTMGYAAAVNMKGPNQVEEEQIEPGWVKLKWDRTTGKTEWKGGVPTNLDDDEERRRGIVLKNMVNKWQRERDEITDVMDQASPYWGVKDLNTPLSDDDLSDSESETGSESDLEEWSDGVDSN